METSGPRRIVGIDGRIPARAALGWAARRSAADGVPLVVAHVEPAGAAGTEQSAGSALEDALAAVRTEFSGPVESLSLAGPVWQALGDAATPDDIIVIDGGGIPSRHGRVGGVSSIQIAATARCAVAVIPDIDLSFRRGVVAGIGVAACAGRVAVAAHAEARHRAAPLTLVHAGCTERCTDGLDAAEQALPEGDPGISVRRRVLSTPPADALLDTALDKELLVLGGSSRGTTGAPIGAVTLGVLMNLTVPVLLLGPG